VTLLVTAAAGVLTTLVVTRLPPAHALLTSIVLMVGYMLFNGIVLFDYGNTILGVAGPMTAIATVWAGGTLSRLGIERKERERVRRLFGNYVDPDLIEFGLETDDESVFKGAERDMTVVFTDLKGFTPLSEALGREIIPLLNQFMGRATTVIKRHRGFVNKFLGDGVMFFFNAPRNNPDYARDAIEAVLDLQKMVADFTKELAAQGLPELELRAGVTTGEMVVGNAGSEERSDYTVLGNLVNLAARLESANKAMGTSNLMIDRTVELGGKGFLVRPVGKLCVVGLSEGVMTSEAVCPEHEATEAKRRLVEMSREVVNAFLDARPADCLEAVTKMEEALGESKFTQVYREKCERYLRAADPGEFECQIVLTEK
jgi:adenylate cyclase